MIFRLLPSLWKTIVVPSLLPEHQKQARLLPLVATVRSHVAYSDRCRRGQFCVRIPGGFP